MRQESQKNVTNDKNQLRDYPQIEEAGGHELNMTWIPKLDPGIGKDTSVKLVKCGQSITWLIVLYQH